LKTKRNYLGRLSGFILITFLLFACTDKPDQVGLGLQPTSIELSVIFDDASGLLVHSLREDSVRTDANVIKTGTLGSMLDPVMGKTTGEIFSQFRLEENGHNFGTDPVLDSLVLSLSYSSFYGDSLTSQTVKVFQLDADMNPDTAYYSNQTISAEDTELASITFIPLPSDSVNVGGKMEGPQLRIKLSDDFGQSILDADPLVFDNNEKWLEFMKGLKITTEPVMSGGGMMMFDMFAANTILTLYYKNDSQDTLEFTFLSNENCARFTNFNHNDYMEASPAFKAQVLNGDTSQGEELYYLQGMGGVKAQIRLPDIQEFFADGPVSINEAKLVFNVIDDGSELTPPTQLGLAIIDEEGDYQLLPDANEPTAYYGGYLDGDDNKYFFRISQYIQQVLTGNSPNYPLILLVSGGSFKANRVIMHGPDSLLNNDLRMTLNVIYTKVN
jgi:hypothetical protein